MMSRLVTVFSPVSGEPFEVGKAQATRLLDIGWLRDRLPARNPLPLIGPDTAGIHDVLPVKNDEEIVVIAPARLEWLESLSPADQQAERRRMSPAERASHDALIGQSRPSPFRGPVPPEVLAAARKRRRTKTAARRAARSESVAGMGYGHD